MTRLKSSEMTETQKRGRNNKKRGASVERSLVKWLNTNRIPARRVVMSGALKFHAKDLAGDGDNYRGDVLIETNDKPVRFEVKSRKKLPSYVTGEFRGKIKKVSEVEDLCYILNDEEFLCLCFDDVLPNDGEKVKKSKCVTLDQWFEQDEAEVVAMKEFGKQKWYFAVKHSAVKRLGGKYKCW